MQLLHKYTYNKENATLHINVPIKIKYENLLMKKLLYYII